MSLRTPGIKRASLLALFLFLFSALSVQADPPSVVSHRGVIESHPENTLAGFKACFESFIAAELDVRRTKDGKLVVMHDADVARTTGGKSKVEDLTLAEIKKLDAGNGARVPELAKVFALLKAHPFAGVGLAIDLKIDDGKVEADVVKLAREAKVLDRLVFIGTAIEKYDVRKRLRYAEGGAHVACLATPETLDAACEDVVSDWVYLRFVPEPAQVRQIRNAGKQIFVAGPLFAKKSEENWKAATRAGVDAILTDFPEELKDVLKP